MKRSTAPWTTAIAAAALFALPPSAWAQTTATTQPPAATAASPTSQDPADSPQAHIRAAEDALNSISPTAVTGKAKMRFAELKRHLNALERSAAANDSASAAGVANQSAKATSGARGDTKWASDAAAVDRIIGELLGSSTGAEPTATGTSGTAGATGTSGTSASAGATLDADTREKLTQVRTHVTAFAAAMSGTASAPSATAPAATEPPTSATQPPTSATQPPTSTEPATSATQPSTTTEPASATAAATPQVDAEAAKRHLTAARETLSQLTQLPAASQLTGESRTQISQLISNFNELITTNAEWRASYAKIEANLTALIGSQTTDESAATPTSGTAGAVGTSGTAASGIDPAIRAKLVEFRSHLTEFEKAAGGAATPAAATPSATTPSATTEPSPSAPAAAQAAAGHEEALRHLAAIEAILNGDSASAATGTSGTATSGTAGSPSAPTSTAPVTLDRAKLDQLRMHLNELKRLLNQAK